MSELAKLSHEEQFKKVKDICQPFLLTDEQLITIKDSFLSEIQKGLRKATNETSSIKCSPTYVYEFPTGCEHGMFLVMKMGGKKFHISCIHLKGPRDYSVQKCVYDMSHQLESENIQILFDRITECLHIFLKEHDLLREPLSLTLCLTYICHCKSLTNCEVRGFTKNMIKPVLLNRDVVVLLREAIERRKDLRIKIVAVVNDCTAALLCSNQFENVCKIGVTIGSSCNAAYVEETNEIELLGEEDSSEIKHMVINTDWSEFGSNGHLDAIYTEFDKQLDQVSSNQGKQKFIKMTAGFYMGELARQVIAHCIKEGILFEGRTSPVLSSPFKFIAKDVSSMLAEDEGCYDRMRLIFDTLGISQPPEHEFVKVHYILQAITQRSANLVACGIASLMEKINETHTGVAMCGSFFFKSRIYKDLLEKKLTKILDGKRTFVIKAKEESVAVGAAILAAITTRHEFLFESDEIKKVLKSQK